MFTWILRAAIFYGVYRITVVMEWLRLPSSCLLWLPAVVACCGWLRTVDGYLLWVVACCGWLLAVDDWLLWMVVCCGWLLAVDGCLLWLSAVVVCCGYYGALLRGASPELAQISTGVVV
jgi:hypothetical protein